MEIKDIDTVVLKLNEIEKTFGIGGVLLVITAVIVLILSWNYLKRKIGKIAEEASEKSLKKFQSQLDKELVKFSTKHQKQVDAIHETFQKFQKMTALINFLLKGEKFTHPMNPKDEIAYLVKFRHDFKKTYNENRLLFPTDLCVKIDTLIPSVDKFIEIYKGGLFAEQTEEEKKLADEENGGLYIAGVWSVDAFDDTLQQLETVSKEIEKEFRTIYGTDE